jgi:hypothetical protein
MEITGTAKKGAKPTATFNLSNGAEVVCSPQHLDFIIISAWEAEGRAYRSYGTKSEAKERLELVKRLVTENAGKFAKDYGVYVMELQSDLSYSCIAKWERSGK